MSRVNTAKNKRRESSKSSLKLNQVLKPVLFSGFSLFSNTQKKTENKFYFLFSEPKNFPHLSSIHNGRE
jgi:hypothetical protein